MPRKTEPPQRPDPRTLTASMRPRPDAAENILTEVAILTEVRTCFNEAAARCRGKPGKWQNVSPTWYSLQ